MLLLLLLLRKSVWFSTFATKLLEKDKSNCTVEYSCTCKDYNETVRGPSTRTTITVPDIMQYKQNTQGKTTDAEWTDRRTLDQCPSQH